MQLSLLALWLGAAIFFGAAVAPTLFQILRAAQLPNANELAGTIVTRLLALINIGGFVVSLFLIATGYFLREAESRFALVGEMTSAAIMAIMTGVGQWVISTRMVGLRMAMQAPIDQVARDDPRRVAFDSLHHYSVAVMGVALVAGFISFFLISIQSRHHS